MCGNLFKCKFELIDYIYLKREIKNCINKILCLIYYHQIKDNSWKNKENNVYFSI